MIQKLRIKFIVINMSIVTIMLCVILGLVFYFTRANLEAESINMMRNIANQPFELRIPDEPGRDVRLPYFILQMGPRGELITPSSGYYDLSDHDFLDTLMDVVFASPKTFGVIRDYNLRYYRMDTPVNQYFVFADISSEITTLDNLTKNSFLIGGVSFLMFLGVSILLSKWAVRPVEQAWRQQRQFVADASHELKTPLTVIMTNAELAQSREYSEESKQNLLSGIMTMSHQMKYLIEQMLELVKTDQTEMKIIFCSVNFSQLVSNAILPFEPVFFENGMPLVPHVDEKVRVLGEENQLRQVTEILLDNALKYAKEKGTTWVNLTKQGDGHCLLTVSNEGGSISPEELQSIFKRFYRIDKARSRTGSFGLGLSIAESIVLRHKGKIWAESKNGINSFYILLPCQ